MAEFDLKRFLEAQEREFPIALKEIKNGKKVSHWMWYIFPQIIGLGRTSISQYYAIANLNEAKAYMSDPILKAHMLEICEALLALKDKDAGKIFGFPDHLKLKSCMTLFEMAAPECLVFGQVLEQYFEGNRDQSTIDCLAYTEANNRLE